VVLTLPAQRWCNSPSTLVKTTVVTYHSCDRRSCLGCATLKLQALCYAAQQCAVVSCVGTVVNQNRHLCNVGLVLKSYTEGTLSMMLGAWLIFTETYTKLLDAALLGPSDSASIKWVDDAFYSYICSAKVSFLLAHECSPSLPLSLSLSLSLSEAMCVCVLFHLSLSLSLCVCVLFHLYLSLSLSLYVCVLFHLSLSLSLRVCVCVCARCVLSAFVLVCLCRT
jgi:hypothetical protein